MANSIHFNREIHFEYGEAKVVAPGVRRLVVRNASPFTFKGTNCYILGRGELAVIDPGPADEVHIAELLRVTEGETITQILVTHTHMDHSPGTALLQQATGARTYGMGPVDAPRGTADHSPNGKDFVDHAFNPDVVLGDNSTFEGPIGVITAIHTPGHAPDHLCFGLVDQRMLFSGDHIMAWNTSVIAPPEGSMSDYMASLKKLLDRDDDVYWPGHGGRVTQPRRLVKAFIMHRQWREAAVYECLENGPRSIDDIVAETYRDIKDSVRSAAAMSVHAHLEYLAQRGKVRVISSSSGDQVAYERLGE